MSDGPRLLLIDANNMCHRVFWAKKNAKSGGLSYKGRAVDVLYGFFRQLIHLKKKYPEHFPIIAWDRGYARRLAESQKGVEEGIVPSAYKQPRKEAQQEKEQDRDEDYLSLMEQMEQVRDSLELVYCIQVALDGFEADDIIYSYARTYADWDGKSVIVSTDKDFYQAIDDATIIYDAMKKQVWTKERFELEFGFSPHLWVDVGAIMGEVGPSKDNIFGVDGWGPKTACQYVQEYGDVDAIIAVLEAKKKRGKREQAFLDQIPRLRLAKSLKQMDIIPDLPKPRVIRPVTEEALKQFFIEWGFVSLLKEAIRLV